MTTREPVPSDPFDYDEDHTLYTTRYVKMLERICTRRATGSKISWTSVSVADGRTAVGCVALTDCGDVLFNRIYRYPVRGFVYEPIVGLPNEGEAHEAAVHRELEEETGYTATQVIHMITGVFDPGLLENKMAFYLALGARRTHEPRRENEEEIEVMRMPLAGAIDFLEEASGAHHLDHKLISLIHLVERYLSRNRSGAHVLTRG